MLEDTTRVKILDGSFGFQIRNHLDVQVDHDPLWSSMALLSNPEAVIRTHMDFIKSESDIIETNTYQASTMGFKKYLGLSEQDSFKLIKKAVDLAREAINRCLQQELTTTTKPLIAGSVGPYGAFLHDGSEYNGKYTEKITLEQLELYHAPRLEALVEAGVDLLAIETIPSRKEALFLTNFIKKYPGVKAWLSFSCKSDGVSTAFGDDFQKTALECYDLNPQQIIAVGVNCIAPHVVELLFNGINENRTDKIPLVVYANSGETYDTTTKKWDTKCEKLESYIPKWLDQGVKYVGGCCRVCSNSIRTIKDQVTAWEAQQCPKPTQSQDNPLAQQDT